MEKRKDLKSMRAKSSKPPSNPKKKGKVKVQKRGKEVLSFSDDASQEEANVIKAKVDSIKDIGDSSIEKNPPAEVVVEVAEPSYEEVLEEVDSSKELTSSKEVALYQPDKVSDPLTVYIREINRYDLLSL